jgi:hypothetical protein
VLTEYVEGNVAQQWASVFKPLEAERAVQYIQNKSCTKSSLNDRDTEKHIITSAECLGYGTMQLIILHDTHM